jgi:glycosyltransferase involved in cell wall biosynthesis
VDGLVRASDFFVLPSLAEGLPRALVEAQAHGIPCVAHDYSVAHYALGEHALVGDFTKPGALAGLLEENLDQPWDADRARARQRHVHDNFSWDVLAPRYVEMLVGAKGRAPFPD